MKTLFVSLLAAVVGGAFATPAPQQPAPRVAQASPVPPNLPALGTEVPVAPSARWNVAQLRQSFTLADANGDGVLTRAEAQQLIILPRTFDELDANKDGVLSRLEYEAILRQ